MEIVAEARGDRDVESLPDGVGPGEDEGAGVAEEVRHPGGEDRARGLRAEQLDAPVVQGGEDVGDPGRGGDAVDDEQDAVRGPGGAPSG